MIYVIIRYCVTIQKPKCTYFISFITFRVRFIVLILGGNSKKGDHIRSNFCYLSCLRCLIGLGAVVIRIFFTPEIPIFLHACAPCYELPSDISTMSAFIEGNSGLSPEKTDNSRSISIQYNINAVGTLLTSWFIKNNIDFR